MAGSATAEKSAEGKKEERVKTQYVVLQVTEDQITPVGEGYGLNDLQAIGEVAGQQNIQEGSFVAVPTRSWRVRSVSVQTKRSVQIK